MPIGRVDAHHSAAAPEPQGSLKADGPFAQDANLASIAAGTGTITNGSRGSHVRLVQSALIEQGYAMPRWGADGAWGSESTGALKGFQRDHQLPETGVVDSATLLAIDQASTGGTPAAQGLRPDSPLAAESQLREVAEGNATLANGSRGTGVRALQQALTDAGIDVPGGVDGWYGGGTASAIKTFQGQAGLPETGICDSATLLALDRKIAAGPSDPGEPTEVPGNLSEGSPLAQDAELRAISAGTGSLSRGARGEGVRLTQQALTDLGYNVSGGADGVFGRGTQAAITQFQKDAGLSESGNLDQQTLLAIDQRIATGDTSGVTPGTNVEGAGREGIQNTRFQDPSLEAVASGASTLGPGSRGPGVTACQKALLDLGFKLPRFGADGAYGGEMNRAVWRFQMETGLPRTGRIDQATLEALDRVAPPPGKAIEKMPDYESVFADGRADMTIAIGYDESGTTDGTVQKTLRNLINRGFSRIDPESMPQGERERLGLSGDRFTSGASYYHKSETDPQTGKPVDYVCRVITPDASDNPSEVAGMFRNAMENDEIVMYNGHARYGTGPDFDDIHSGAGNFVINEDGNSHGSHPPAYLSEAINGRDTDLSSTGGPGKYQLLYFGACSTENYLENLRNRFPGRSNDNTDIFGTTTPTFVASGAEHTDLFVEGILGRRSVNDINDRINDNEVGWHEYFGPDGAEDERDMANARGTMMDNGFLGNRHNRLVDSTN
ncbi:peptidoglycan-binding protein [Planctomycetota bacterium]